MHLNKNTYVHKIFIFKILPLSKNSEATNSWNYHGIVHFWTCGTTRNGSSDCPTLHLQKNGTGPLEAHSFSYMECH